MKSQKIGMHIFEKSASNTITGHQNIILVMKIRQSKNINRNTTFSKNSNFVKFFFLISEMDLSSEIMNEYCRGCGLSHPPATKNQQNSSGDQNLRHSVYDNFQNSQRRYYTAEKVSYLIDFEF
jgi:hypothetical protein